MVRRAPPTRAPIWTARPPHFPSIISTSPVCRPARISSPAAAPPRRSPVRTSPLGRGRRTSRGTHRRGVDLRPPVPSDHRPHRRVMSLESAFHPRRRAPPAFSVEPTMSVNRTVASTRSIDALLGADNGRTLRRCRGTRPCLPASEPVLVPRAARRTSRPGSFPRGTGNPASPAPQSPAARHTRASAPARFPRIEPGVGSISDLVERQRCGGRGAVAMHLCTPSEVRLVVGQRMVLRARPTCCAASIVPQSLRDDRWSAKNCSCVMPIG